MNGSVERCIKKANSKLERKRRRNSQIPLFEKPVDAAKEERSIKMAHWPKKRPKKSEKTE